MCAIERRWLFGLFAFNDFQGLEIDTHFRQIDVERSAHYSVSPSIYTSGIVSGLANNPAKSSLAVSDVRKIRSRS